MPVLYHPPSRYMDSPSPPSAFARISFTNFSSASFFFHASASSPSIAPLLMRASRLCSLFVWPVATACPCGRG